ncbi:MAG: hypothetical protein KDG50_01405 [Chromatiales bacterium]|nr:hypothetical protein [Chromatiales bacterium]
MSILKLFHPRVWVVFAVLIAIPTGARAIDVDLVGTVHIVSAPVIIIGLTRGAYTATPFDGTYQAWTKWGDTPTGCDGSGENCAHGWLNDFTVRTSAGERRFRSAISFATPQQALNAAQSGTFCVPYDQDVAVFLSGETPGEEGDNSGGMSIRIEPAAGDDCAAVPASSSGALFGLALLIFALGVVAVRQHRTI